MSRFRFQPVIPSEGGFAPEVLSELPTYIQALVANGDSPGAVTLLAKGDRIIHSSVTGYADAERRTPLQHDSIFGLFSMTKPLAAVGMLLLWDEGKWQPKDPVSLHLPEFKDIAQLEHSAASREPTVLELFTHTAGFSFGRTPEEMLRTIQTMSWGTASSLSQLIGRYAAMPLTYEPGTDWQYSVATDLQAEMIERISGERFDLFLTRRLFQPLGMYDTGFQLDQDQLPRLVKGHTIDHESGRLRGATAAERMDAIFPMGGTSLKSTALDYARFARMLLNKGELGGTRILSEVAVELMLSNHLPDDLMEGSRTTMHYVVGQGNGYGLNGMVCVDPVKAGRPVGKGTYEWGGAFGTWFWIDPANDILFVGMTHSRRSHADMRPLDVISQDIVYRALHGADVPT